MSRYAGQTAVVWSDVLATDGKPANGRSTESRSSVVGHDVTTCGAPPLLHKVVRILSFQDDLGLS